MSRRPPLHYIPRMRASPPAILAACCSPACGESAPPAPVVTLAAGARHRPDRARRRDDAARGWAEPDGRCSPRPTSAVARCRFGDAPARLRSARGGKELRNPSTLFRAGDTLVRGRLGPAAHVAAGPSTGASPARSRRRRGPRRPSPRAAMPRAGSTCELAPAARARRSGQPRLGRGGADADPGSTRVDTIARLAPLDIAEVTGDAGRRFERRVFSGADQWGALPDGSVWVARVYENRVDWRDPDGPVDPRRAAARPGARGDPLRSRALRPQVSARASQHGRAASVRAGEAAVRGRASPARTGEVWLEKSRAPVDSSRRYHVVDRQGRLRRGDPGPGPGRIIAVGTDAALVAEPSRDGVRCCDSSSGPRGRQHAALVTITRSAWRFTA